MFSAIDQPMTALLGQSKVQLTKVLNVLPRIIDNDVIGGQSLA